MTSVPETSNGSRCNGRNRAGLPCGRRAVKDGFCTVHHPEGQDMKELGRRGGRARTRPGMGGKQLAATLRDRLRESVDEDKLAQVLVSGLESESARERLDVAKLVLAELHASTSTSSAATACTCESDPGAWCGAPAPHGYRSKGGTVEFWDVVAAAVECGFVTAENGGAVLVEGRRVERTTPTPSSPRENESAREWGYPPPSANNESQAPPELPPDDWPGC